METKKELMPVKNYRKTMPRCCGTCKWYEETGDGPASCEREGGFHGDFADMEQLFHVCDLWKQNPGIAFNKQ